MAVTLQLIEALQSGLVDPTTGLVLASGKCRFYDVSTLTPQTVYSDSAGATPITQPLTLTAGGTGTVYTANPCRCIVKDSSDVGTVYDIAVVNASIPAAQFVTSTAFNGGVQTTLQTILDNVDDSLGGSAGYWKYKIGTSERNIKDVISEIQLTPQDYGALGDGATDDTAAFAALAVAQASTGRPVFIPKGIYQLSAAVTFTAAGLVLRGSGHGDVSDVTAPAAVLRGTNGTMNVLAISGASPVVENLLITHATTSSGAAIILSGIGDAAIRSVHVISGKYTTAFSNGGSSGSHATDCQPKGITNATVGTWLLANCSTSGALSANTRLLVSVLNTGGLFMTATADMANGGSTTPSVGQAAAGAFSTSHLRIRGTSAGGGTINATGTPVDTKYLTLDCFNNSGGAYTFTLNAQYHSSGNPAPANGTRRVVTFVWDTTSSIWIEIARSPADIT